MRAKDIAGMVSLIATIKKDPLKVTSLSPNAKKEVLAFVRELFHQCMKVKVLPANISLLLNDTKDLVRYASQLIIYRAALGEIGTQQQLYNLSYEQFVEQSQYFKDGLKKGNPFILRVHLVRIHDLIQNHDLSDEQKLALVDLLLTSQNYIAAMDSEHCGKFKCLVDGYAKYRTAALLNSLTSTDKQEELAPKVEQLYLSAIESLEMATKSPSKDISMILYGHQEIYPKFSFADSNELIALIKSNPQVTQCQV